MKIQNIWAVGRNYIEHAHEMKSQLPDRPLIFLKAGTCITQDSTIELPSWCTDVHHELELGFQVLESDFQRVQPDVGTLTKNSLSPLDAFEIDFDRTKRPWYLALDLTERTLQGIAKDTGSPWTLAKSFQNACPLSTSITTSWEDISQWKAELLVDHVLKQQMFPFDMHFKPKEIFAFVKNHFPIIPGDLILTGTPKGVGPIVSGSFISLIWNGKPHQTWKVNKNS